MCATHAAVLPQPEQRRRAHALGEDDSGHRECWLLTERGFRDWLRFQFYSRSGRAPKPDSFNQALDTLIPKARYEGSPAPVFLRRAEHEGKSISSYAMRLGGLLRSMRSAGALSMSPTRASSVAAVCSRSPGLSNGQQKTIAFHQPALARIKARLDRLGISPTSFPWRPGDLPPPHPIRASKASRRAKQRFSSAGPGDIARGLAEIRKLRRTTTGQVLVIQAASGAGKSSFLKLACGPGFRAIQNSCRLPSCAPQRHPHRRPRHRPAICGLFRARDPSAARSSPQRRSIRSLRKPDEEARAFLGPHQCRGNETAMPCSAWQTPRRRHPRR